MASNLENDEGHDQENEQGEARPKLSAPRLVEGVRDLLLLWLKQAHQQKPWPNMSEAEQATWINRINERAELLIDDVIEVVTHGDFPVINAMIDSFTVKKGEVKVVAKGFADNEMLSVLNDAGEKRVQITVMRNDQFDQHRDKLNPEPDQPGLPGVKVGEPGFDDDDDDRPHVEEPEIENPEGEAEAGEEILTPKSDQWRGGFNSRQALHERRENPFNPGANDFHEWMAGWDAANEHPETKPFPGSGEPAPTVETPAVKPKRTPKPKAGPIVEPDIEPETEAPDGDRQTEGEPEANAAAAITDQEGTVIENDAQAHAYGKWCRADGRGTGANPFPVASDFGKQWLRGYSDERREEKTRTATEDF